MSQPNPYQSPAVAPETPAPTRRPGEDALYSAAQGQNIVGGLGLLVAIFSMADAMYFLLFGDIARPAAPFNLAISAWMVIQCSLMLAGGISMHQHKRRWLTIVGAWAGIWPLCGCYVFSLVSGIWVLMVLRRPDVKALFESKQHTGHES